MKKVLILSAPLSSQGSPDHSLTTVTLGFGTGQWTIRFWCSSSRASPLRAAPDKPWPGRPDTGSVPPPGSHGNRGAQPRRHPSLGPNHSSRGSSPGVMATREFARTSASYSVPIFLPRLSDTPPPPIACGPCEGKAAVWLLASNVAPIPGPRMGRLGRGARQAQDGADAGGARRRHAKGAWPAEGGGRQSGQDGARRVICTDFSGGGSGTRAGGSAPPAALPPLPAPGAPACPSSLGLGGWGEAGLVPGTACRTLRRRARTGNWKSSCWGTAPPGRSVRGGLAVLACRPLARPWTPQPPPRRPGASGPGPPGRGLGPGAKQALGNGWRELPTLPWNDTYLKRPLVSSPMQRELLLVLPASAGLASREAVQPPSGDGQGSGQSGASRSLVQATLRSSSPFPCPMPPLTSLGAPTSVALEYDPPESLTGQVVGGHIAHLVVLPL